MIWHIFKKDWKLEWKLAALVAAVQFACAGVLIKLGPLPDSRSLYSLWQLLLLATLAGIPFLIVAVVHQDAIPGVRQDWIIRPIRRGELLLAKLLFVLIAVHGPMLLADLYRGLANGFAFGPSLSAAISHGLFVLVALSIPTLAFASLTRTTMEAIAAGLIVFLCFASFQFLVDRSMTRQDLYLRLSNLSWIIVSAQCLVGLAGAAAVLGIQYFRRRTLTAREVAGGAMILALLTLFLPWNPAFALERHLSPDPGAASAVSVSFDPGLGRFHRVTPAGANSESAHVFLPLRFENLPAGSALISDRVELWRRDERGVSKRVGIGLGLSVRQETGDPAPETHLLLSLPGDLYQRIQDQPGPLQVELWLTLFRSSGSQTLPAIGATGHLRDLGFCVTKINALGTVVRLGCAPREEQPSCVVSYLQHIPSGRTNYPRFGCNGDYAPFFDELFVTPPRTLEAAFRDPSGLGKYPVDGSQLSESQIVIETYKPADHFTRTVMIPSTRLRDWQPE